MAGCRAFEIGRAIPCAYALLALALSSALLLQSRQRGPAEFSFWLSAYVGVGLVSSWRPRWSPLAAGAAAFLLGIVKTHRAGPNLDLGLGLIALSLAVFVLDRLVKGEPMGSLDPAGMALLLIAAWSLVSLGFVVPRIRGFAPAPGFGYRPYPFNALRLSSEEALIRAVIGATAMFSWFGLYEFGRSVSIPRGVLRGVVTGLLLLNGVTLLVQQHVDPFFLLHAGRPIGRFNGVTSYCYALGDAALAFFLLLPAWGSSRGRAGVLTLVNLALIVYAVVASGSRLALLVPLVVTFAWAGVRAFRLSRKRPRLAAAVSLGGVALFLAVATWAYRATPADWVSPVGRLKLGIERDGLLGHLFVTRLNSYRLVGRVLAAYPLTGVGAGLYAAEVSKQHALLAPQAGITEPYLQSSFVPNQFLNAGAELGAPALIALIVAFACVGVSAFSRRGDPRLLDLAVSFVGLTVALQAAPSFYTSEALVFSWLVVGGAASGSLTPRERAAEEVPRAGTAALLAGAVALGIVGQILARPALALDSQWRRLRWPMNLGLLRREEGGRWTRPETTFTVNAAGPQLRLRWHVGDVAAPDYQV